MNSPGDTASSGQAIPPLIPAAPTQAIPSGKVLHRLFLTLFLRGRSSRGLSKDKAPKSVGAKLAMTILLYSAFGFMAFFLKGQPVFTLSIYLHAMTLVFLGLFVANSAGEVLFNKEEADILLHRPVTSKALLWAKIGVLVEISLWLSGALNLAGLFVGMTTSAHGWMFPVVHAISTTLEALLCTGFVVLAYQLCLRWFGRERLDGLMTTVQVIAAVVATLGGQLAPQLIGRFGGRISSNLNSWWIGLLPPAWFAGLDDALAGSGAPGSWVLAGFGLIATTVVLWLAFVKLARDYETGLQTLSETLAPRKKRPGHRRWTARLVEIPPLSWWLRDSVARASFLLAAAYLFRDRETKLRVYPSLAPMLVMPFVMLMQRAVRGGQSGFEMAFCGAYLGVAPLVAINLLQYSQQWQAADLFRAAPMRGPEPLCHGSRRAVLLFVAVPLIVLFGLIAWLLNRDFRQLLLLLPGVISLPIYAMIGCVGGKAVPFSMPTEEGKAARRGIVMMGAMMVAFALGGLVTWSWSAGWFWWLVLAETIIALILYATMRAALARVTWPSME